MSTASARPAWLARFLAPQYALANYAIMQWQSAGEADTPGADARCRVHVACAAQATRSPIVAAAFSAYGPPVVVACADWLCEQIHGLNMEQARGIALRDIETALELAPGERYAALLVLDALASALNNLG